MTRDQTFGASRERVVMRLRNIATNGPILLRMWARVQLRRIKRSEAGQTAAQVEFLEQILGRKL